jgi:hypothetical protein
MDKMQSVRNSCNFYVHVVLQLINVRECNRISLYTICIYFFHSRKPGDDPIMIASKQMQMMECLLPSLYS